MFALCVPNVGLQAVLQTIILLIPGRLTIRLLIWPSQICEGFLYLHIPSCKYSERTLLCKYQGGSAHNIYTPDTNEA